MERLKRIFWMVLFLSVIPSASASVGDGFVISQRSPNNERAAVAFDGTNFLAVWDNNNGSAIYASRVQPLGGPLDTDGFFVGQGANPDVAFGADTYLVVWETGANIFARALSRTGSTVGDAIQLTSGTAREEHAPGVSFNGEKFLVVWDAALETYGIFGTRIDTNMVVLDSPAIVIHSSTETNGCQNPAVASKGYAGDWFVSWEKLINSIFDIYGTGVAPSGLVWEPDGVVISDATGHQVAAAVDFDDSNHVVVWEDFRDTSTVYDIYGSRVTTTSEVLDSNGIQISVESNSQYGPQISFNGSDSSVVVWTDFRNGDTDQIFGTCLFSSGVVSDTAGTLFSGGAGANDKTMRDIKVDPANGWGLVVFQELTNLRGLWVLRCSPQ